MHINLKQIDMKNFVYLIKSKNKLMIASVAISDADYHLLVGSEGPQSFEYCKMYCLGAIAGNQVGDKFANTVLDFQ